MSSPTTKVDLTTTWKQISTAGSYISNKSNKEIFYVYSSSSPTLSLDLAESIKPFDYLNNLVALPIWAKVDSGTAIITVVEF
jgi:hypothetical protein